MTGSVVAAIFNTSQDVIDLLRRAFEPAGIIVVSAFTHQIREGNIDVERFLQQHNPDVIVYDVAPPYDANWRLFQHLRTIPAMRERPLVLTSAAVHHVEGLLNRDDRVYEVVGTPLDLERIVRAVKEAARSRPTYQ